jgi:TonB family protein
MEKLRHQLRFSTVMLVNQSLAKRLMLKRMSIVLANVVVMLVCINSFAQSNTGSLQQFAKDGLRFDYPGGWTLKDTSDADKQYIRLEFDNSSALIMIIADRDLIGLPEYLPALRRHTELFIAETTLKFGGVSVTSEELHIALKNAEADGVRLRGTLEKEPVSAEVYSFVERSRFINLVYLRPDKNGAALDPAFAIVRNTLSIDPHKKDPPSDTDKDLGPRLLKFAKPAYPKLLAQSRLRGTVTVKVIIDEGGNVIDAMATSGPKEFFDNSIAAARKTKFTPTKNHGYPVKVTGVIQYTFEAPVSSR